MGLVRTGRVQLFKLDDANTINWHHLWNYNVDLMQEVLKLKNLRDVSTILQRDKSIVKYNSSSSKWEITIDRGYN